MLISRDLIHSFRTPKIADLGYSPYFATNIKFDFDLYKSSNSSFGKIVAFDGWVVDLSNPHIPMKIYIEFNNKTISVERYSREDIELAFAPKFKVAGEVGFAAVVSNLPILAVCTVFVMNSEMLNKKPIFSKIFI